MLENKNPLILAFVGDAVQTLHVRASLADTDARVSALHKMASAQICATAQSERFEKIAPLLTETERDIATRARNAPHNTLPKSCTPADYHRATAFEAVLGYNYLKGNYARVKELIEC